MPRPRYQLLGTPQGLSKLPVLMCADLPTGPLRLVTATTMTTCFVQDGLTQATALFVASKARGRVDSVPDGRSCDAEQPIRINQRSTS